ncbi:major facilitator superfamily domain-containing protein [Immersiella caudata]|uniref:Efflux pump dotC n=1 Tax=Immersiella caudata TaxID=314043 RepID=A0AA40C7K8_9PEZI|nr:major facilitator superfamily domain-containing protein [Immersiella caudata]
MTATEPPSLSTPTSPPRQGKLRTTLSVLALATALFLTAMDVTIVSTVVPTIASEFRSSLAYTWVGSAYLLASAAFVPIWGKVSDIFGRRAIVQLAVGVFGIGSLLCGASGSVAMLIAGRAVQGVGAGGVLALVYVCIGDMFSVRDRGVYFGALGIVWVVASAMGPVLGGVFTNFVTWRWCFYINLPICGVGMVAIHCVLHLHNPRTPVRQGLAAIDWVGSSAIISGTLLLLLGLEFGSALFTWNTPTVVCLLVFGLTTLGMAGAYLRHFARHPVIPLHLFGNRSNCGALATAFIHGFVLISASYWLPLYFQSVLGVDALQSGVYLLPYSLSLSITSAIAGWAMKKTGHYLAIIIGAMAVTVLGFGLLVDLGSDGDLIKIIAYQIVAGAGVGPNSQATLVALQTTIEPRDMAAVTCTFAFTRQLATAISISVGGAVFGVEMQRQQTDIAAVFGPGLADMLSGRNAATNAHWVASLSGEQGVAARGAYQLALQRMRIVFAAVAGVGLVSSLFIRNMELSQNHGEHQTGLATLQSPRRED